VQLVHTAKRSFRTLLPCAAAAHAQWLACALPCRRFADTLADANARLGADAVRYSFIAVDFHHLLFAGLFRRTAFLEAPDGARLTYAAAIAALGRCPYRKFNPTGV
jgi:hypothetical protein